MNEQLEAIKEAITFIQHNWIGASGLWKGEVSDFVGAVLENAVTKSDVRQLIQAINSGEPTSVEDLGGVISNGKLVTVWVSKCMD